MLKNKLLKPYPSPPRHAQPVTGKINLTLTIAEVGIQLSGRAKFKSNSTKLVSQYEFTSNFDASRRGCEGINNLVASTSFTG